jgi:hypothetical protein
MAARCEGCSGACSNTIRTARSLTSGEYVLDLFMAPISQALEPPTIPRRFTEIVMPDLYGRAFDAYRALWESIRDRRGWVGNKNSSYAGGWTTKRVGSQEQNYNLLNPVFIQGVVDANYYSEVVGSLAESREEQAVIEMDIPDADDGIRGSDADLVD